MFMTGTHPHLTLTDDAAATAERVLGSATMRAHLDAGYFNTLHLSDRAPAVHVIAHVKGLTAIMRDTLPDLRVLCDDPDQIGASIHVGHLIGDLTYPPITSAGPAEPVFTRGVDEAHNQPVTAYTPITLDAFATVTLDETTGTHLTGAPAARRIIELLAAAYTYTRTATDA